MFFGTVRTTVCPSEGPLNSTFSSSSSVFSLQRQHQGCSYFDNPNTMHMEYLNDPIPPLIGPSSMPGPPEFTLPHIEETPRLLRIPCSLFSSTVPQHASLARIKPVSVPTFLSLVIIVLVIPFVALSEPCPISLFIDTHTDLTIWTSTLFRLIEELYPQ